uniref:Claudin n=1 Tax=Salmo trutta TaxID=8032 RepID=A0A674BQI8_SALTR
TQSGRQQFDGHGYHGYRLILTIVICALPTWRVTTIITGNVATTEVVWYGLWMRCATQGTGQTQCDNYWRYNLQPARAMIPTAIILVVLGVMVSMVGAKRTNCIKDKTSQAKMIIIAGILFILAGILILIPVSLVAIPIINDSSTRIEEKPELGNSLYLGWVAASLLLIGGVTLCIKEGVFGWIMGIFGWIVSLTAMKGHILTVSSLMSYTSIDISLYVSLKWDEFIK